LFLSLEETPCWGGGMGVGGVRTLHLRCSPVFLRPPTTRSPRLLRKLFSPPRTLQKRHSLSFHSAASPEPLSYSVENGNANSCTRCTPGVVNDISCNKLLQVVLVSPQIPGNTGSIARTCAASAVGLHLVGPLGYTIEDSKLKRAGLDYWPYVVVKVHTSWAEFREYFRQQDGEKRLLAFTKRGTQIHSDFTYKRGDWLVFGSETSGLPPEALFDCSAEGLGGGTIRIPMVETYVRCLNLSVSVGIALYEASRQLNYEQLQYSLSNTAMAPLPSKAIAAVAGMVRQRLRAAVRTRGGGGEGAGRWTSPGTEERPKGYIFNRLPPPPGKSREWEDWELPCYITSFLAIVILGVGLNAKPDLTLETWAHQKALERLQKQETASDSD
ncbi:unnamed protein product, partial [Musa hybrid cultivar]